MAGELGVVRKLTLLELGALGVRVAPAAAGRAGLAFVVRDLAPDELTRPARLPPLALPQGVQIGGDDLAPEGLVEGGGVFADRQGAVVAQPFDLDVAVAAKAPEGATRCAAHLPALTLAEGVQVGERRFMARKGGGEGGVIVA